MSVKPVQRSKGRSSTAAAAYRAACVIEDNRTGLKHDYTKKLGVEHTEIITPNGVKIPNRSDLWNAAEAAEKRKDGCTAREYEVNLPYQLTAQQRTELAQDFCKQLAEIHGIAVDLCIHKPTDREIAAGTDPRNHHAHILTTTRKITNDGLTDKADIEKAGRKRKDDLNNTRKMWADITNSHLEKAGHKERIDYRSNKERGLDAKPTIKLGQTASEIERRGIQTTKGDINRAIKSDNEQIKTAKLEIYLDKGRLGAKKKFATIKLEREQDRRYEEKLRYNKEKEKNDLKEKEQQIARESHEVWKEERKKVAEKACLKLTLKQSESYTENKAQAAANKAQEVIEAPAPVAAVAEAPAPVAAAPAPEPVYRGFRR